MRLTLLLLLTIATPVTGDEPRTIPFADVYAILPQEGMNGAKATSNADGVPTAKHGASLQRLLGNFKNAGSNVFLVQGESDVEAMEASEHAFAGYVGTERPIAKRDYDPKGTHWMVAYLGAGSSTPVYEIDSITQEGNRIRLTFNRPQPPIVTLDIRRYLYWIPLGKLAAGDYELELFDANREIIVLMRRVEVGPRQRRSR